MYEEELHQGRDHLGPWDGFRTNKQEWGAARGSGGLKLLNGQRVHREGGTQHHT